MIKRIKNKTKHIHKENICLKIITISLNDCPFHYLFFYFYESVSCIHIKFKNYNGFFRVNGIGILRSLCGKGDAQSFICRSKAVKVLLDSK